LPVEDHSRKIRLTKYLNLNRIDHTNMNNISSTLTNWTEIFSGWIAMPLIIILIGTGLFVTLSLGFIQIRRLKHSFQVVLGKYDNPDDEGDVTHFQALSAALSATIGIGNIAGVALAVRIGGPGALFWMWVTALLGMALKYAECTLSHRYRVIHDDGSASGGPMYYIEKGLGAKWKPLAIFFATCAVICSFCTGNMNQANTIGQAFANHHEILLNKYKVDSLDIDHHFYRDIYNADSGYLLFQSNHTITQSELDTLKKDSVTSLTELHTNKIIGSTLFEALTIKNNNIILFAKDHTITENDIPYLIKNNYDSVLIKKLGLPEWISGLIIATLVGLVIIGGIKRIAALASKLVPTMAALYVSGAIIILLTHLENIIPSISSIFREAFSLEAGWGGLITVIMWGVRRGLYSNEAGQGSAPIAHAAAKTKESAREGAVALMGPFIDTIVVCTMTGLAILSTGVLESTDLTGAQLTREAFRDGFSFAPDIGSFIVNIAILLFAYTTMVAWSYYGDRSIEYLAGPKAIKPYRWVYVFFNFLGAVLPLSFVWNFGDIALSLMTIPNLIGVILLTGSLKKITADYFNKSHIPYNL